MFVAALGGAAVAVLVGHGNHSNYSDHSNYSEYADAALLAEIEAQENEIKRLQGQAEDNLQDELVTLLEDPVVGPLIKESPYLQKGAASLPKMSQEAQQKLQDQLEEAVEQDTQKINAIDTMIQKINQMTLTRKP